MPKRSAIEKIAEKLRLIRPLQVESPTELVALSTEKLTDYPPAERWDDWVEYDALAWPRRVKKHYSILPTTCFNCESGCGLLAYVDQETRQIRKFEGNPHHPGSRGRCCAKGPATINQLTDPDRILYPLRRKGERGSGQWERVSWEAVLDEIGERVRKVLEDGKGNEVVYHVGRPGHEGYAERVLQAWGVDGHNSHTNICSAGARLGYSLWQGFDRPSPDHAEADFILLVSAHLESGHYFNPHAQRILDGMMKGAKLAVMDPRLSNTASMADYWLPTYPGSEAAVLLAMARIILEEGLYDEGFMRTWVNWEAYMASERAVSSPTFENFIEALKKLYSEFTPEFAASESGCTEEMIQEVARSIGRAGSRLATHNWRSAGSGNLGGWTVARALHFLNVLTGSVGTRGGTSPSAWNKFKPVFFDTPPAQKFWNELHFPTEYPLCHYEMSFLLPHFLKEGRGRIQVYFTRVFNPVWTYPDGFSWIEVLSDQEKVGLHVALTPTWNETAYFADYVLPMGHSAERHDLISYETHSGVWIAFRQPVLREYARRKGEEVRATYEVNPGEVWEEDEFWIDLSWKIDPYDELGVRHHFESPRRKGEKVTVEEYYSHIFENVPGLPEKARVQGLSPLEYMQRYGAFEVKKTVYEQHLEELSREELDDCETDPATGIVQRGENPVGIIVHGRAVRGFNTPSRKQEIYSSTMVEWGWPEYAMPVYIRSHVHPAHLDVSKNEFCLVPTFRLPTLIHSRSGNAKWLNEISNRNPVWIHPVDARAVGIQDAGLVRVETEIGHFVDRVWVTEAIKPGIIACSHHLGRWRRSQDPPGNRWATNVAKVSNAGSKWKLRYRQEIRPFKSSDRDSARVFWREGGVHQNLTFPVHPDPLSGMHCWHQKVRIFPAGPEDRYGDVVVDTDRSFEVFKSWLKKTRPGPGPGGLRRPLWMNRPLRPVDEMFYLK